VELFIIGHVRKIKILKFIGEIQGSSINPSDSIIVINIAINNDAAHCRLGIVYGVRGKRVIMIFSVGLFRRSSGCLLRVPFSIYSNSFRIFFSFSRLRMHIILHNTYCCGMRGNSVHTFKFIRYTNCFHVTVFKCLLFNTNIL